MAKHLPGQLAEQLTLNTAPQISMTTSMQCNAICVSMIALQEELDWRCYTLYGVTDRDLCYRDASGNQLDPPAIALGQRAFEISDGP